jgi:hypothetical protein
MLVVDNPHQFVTVAAVRIEIPTRLAKYLTLSAKGTCVLDINKPREPPFRTPDELESAEAVNFLLVAVDQIERMNVRSAKVELANPLPELGGK